MPEIEPGTFPYSLITGGAWEHINIAEPRFPSAGRYRLYRFSFAGHHTETNLLVSQE